ncbi:MAG: T9SS type A sorting domain-containing protein [Bacteroidales bacterium]|nr:T9SS type A sorting domain-containing protein [Bacteroidales bacterium]
MKKLLLLTTILMITAMLSAQERVLIPKENLNIGVKTSLDLPSSGSHTILNPFQSNLKSGALAPTEHLIGTTFYDLQANRSLQNRIYRHDDGSIGAVWTRGIDDAPDFPDRGTGYNYYNGTEWGPLPETRIESIRTGWPNYAALGSGGEIIVCHDNNLFKLYFLTRENKGIGDWTEAYYSYNTGPDNLACPRIITAGTDHNTIHMIANTWDEYMGQEYAIIYARSQDGGMTWNIENETLEGTGIDDYQSLYVDSYVWADERAGTLAFLCGTAWYDLFMMKSTDDGDTWEKTIIWQHPYPFFDWSSTITDTFFCMDNSASIALDSDGKAHIVFGINRVIHPIAGNDFWYYPEVDGIGYWNEDMEPFSNDLDALAPPGYGFANSEMVENYNYIGWMQDVNGNGSLDLNSGFMFYMEIGPSTMPSITIDNQDRIFIIYSSTTETYEYENYNYRHIWARACENGFWGPFLDLTEDIAHIYDECFYPVLASSSDENIHYFFNADGIPGLGWGQNHDYIENRIIYGALPKPDLLTGIKEKGEIQDEGMALKTNPNPTPGIINIKYELKDVGEVNMSMINIQGELLQTHIIENQTIGENSTKLDLSHLPDGLYLIRLQAGNNSETSKIIIHK